MQLTSIQPAISNAGGAVTRSAAPPGTASGSVPQTSTPSNSTSPSYSRATVSPATPAGPTGPSRPASPSSRGESGSSGVQVSISEQARRQSPEEGDRYARGAGEEASPQRPARPRGEAGPEPGSENRQGERRQPEQGSEGPSAEQQTAAQELRGRDQEVRQHEQAHQVVGGQYAGAPTYTYQRGPDGQLYAVGGQVSIDTSPIPDDPEATISKMQTVRSAALAPAEPSPQDIRVAQEATRQLLQAQSELRSSRQEESESDNNRVQTTPETEASASDRPGRDDARISLFRDVEELPSTEAATATDPGFRATA
ncbi:putative metalloprotease CJM1_0395 family protein [Halospina sp. K52047b]|uniref:putative metalloprotease CJM1_0395 family protein n=1 Tax=Halospina sp. K52047b TaxID=2614160 RepID=UPI001CE42D02|nr:putative metalloprotease CJM1_0395 family protein [Halospina sp. K52047b]